MGWCRAGWRVYVVVRVDAKGVEAMTYADGVAAERDRIVKLLEANTDLIAEAYASGLKKLVISAVIELIKEGTE